MLKELQSIPVKEIVEGFHARLLHTENFTLSFVEVDKGAILPEHAHFHEQISHVIEGSFEMTIGNTTEVYKPGMVAIIPSNVKHSGRALTACKIHDIFYPVREDYK